MAPWAQCRSLCLVLGFAYEQRHEGAEDSIDFFYYYYFLFFPTHETANGFGNQASFPPGFWAPLRMKPIVS